MSEQVKHSAVQIDTRLSELFVSRRKAQDGSVSVCEENSDAVPSSENSWLLNFAAPPDPEEDQPSESVLGLTSTFVVNKADVRPFWRPKNVKAMTQIWLKSKAALSKDCQKQRKAALRKTLIR